MSSSGIGEKKYLYMCLERPCIRIIAVALYIQNPSLQRTLTTTCSARSMGEGLALIPTYTTRASRLHTS
jgi:hypothetical protein